ncbi:MAG: DNA mismatch repair protein [Halobacteriaceae archaeon]
MQLTDYWGIGPKTRDLLVESLGTEAAIEAIESADVRVLVGAGVPQGRATRILRRADGGGGLDALATRDTRAVYRDLLALARQHAVTRDAGDRICVLTPLADREAMDARLDRVEAAMATWRGLNGEERDAVLEVFDRYDEADSDDLAAVEAARGLQELGRTTGVFEPVAALDADRLADAAVALRAFDGDDLREGVDDRLDALRTAAATARRLESDPAALLAQVRDGGVRDSDAFRTALVRHVATETEVEAARVRAATPAEAADAADFVAATLRTLSRDLESEAADRAESVRAELEEDLTAAGPTVEEAGTVIDALTLDLSLARFVLTYDMSRPTFTEAAALGVEAARNLALEADGVSVQPVSYGLGAHDLDLPSERVGVLTGANSGGKTTLLETLCQVVLLARLGLPVPAKAAHLAPDLRVVFHRRHASFNAGMLESTLQSIVPPLTEPGRTLMLVDEFEAITEPGSAADLLHGLVRLTVGEDGPAEATSLGAFVTHLAEDLEPLPATARVDGIFARGLDGDLDLEVDYQPRFNELGRSTPEFIVSRLLADATDVRSRAGFEALATAVGQEAVQRTLEDARFTD